MTYSENEQQSFQQIFTTVHIFNYLLTLKRMDLKMQLF